MSKTRFQLPPDVSFEKQRLSNAWAYLFRHRVLGELGRILLQEMDDGRCRPDDHAAGGNLQTLLNRNLSDPFGLFGVEHIRDKHLRAFQAELVGTRFLHERQERADPPHP